MDCFRDKGNRWETTISKPDIEGKPFYSLSLSPGRKRKEEEGKGKFDFRKEVKEKEGGRVDGLVLACPKGRRRLYDKNVRRRKNQRRKEQAEDEEK